MPSFKPTDSLRQWIPRLFCAGGIGVSLLIPTVARAAEAVLHTTDGHLVMGKLVVEADDFVILEINGVESVYPKSTVRDLQVILSAEETFSERRKAIADDDLPSRVDLIAQMIEEGVYGLAAKEIVELDRAFPDEPFAQGLAQLLSTAKASEALAAIEAPNATSAAQKQRAQAADFLTPEQITIVKLGERQKPDPDPSIRLVIPPTVITQLFSEHTGHDAVPKTRDSQAAFRQLDPWDQLMVFESAGDHAITGQIRIVGDPIALRHFRQTINPRYIWSYFGRHFSGTVDGLDLVMIRPNSVPEAYTNFVRLSRFTVDGHRMIDRLEPDRSLLLQWGLPREIADVPAPEIPGTEQWKPYFQSRQDPQYLKLLAWIDALMPSPDYLRVLPAPLGGGSALDEADPRN